MAQNNNDWNDFMQRTPVRVILNLVCIVACGSYGVGAVRELLQPSEQAALLIERMGETGYRVLELVLLAVCVWVVVIFVRQTIDLLRRK